MSNPLELLTVAQVAAETGIPARTLLHRIKTGKIAATKLGPGTSPWVLSRETVEAIKAGEAA